MFEPVIVVRDTAVRSVDKLLTQLCRVIDKLATVSVMNDFFFDSPVGPQLFNLNSL